MKSGKMALGEKSLYRSSLRGNKCFSLIAGILFEAGNEHSFLGNESRHVG